MFKAVYKSSRHGTPPPNMPPNTAGGKERVMDTQQGPVDHLSKVTLELTLGTAPDGDLSSLQRGRFTFIFGIGTEGMTPFEYELLGKRPGETVCLQLQAGDFEKTFEHLQPGLLPAAADRQVFSLQARIEAVTPASSREIIRAMAARNSCSDGCDCGCGCG
jgi:hypothetical protein